MALLNSLKRRAKSGGDFRSRELLKFCFFTGGSIIITKKGWDILIVQITKWKEFFGRRETIPWLITTL